MERERERETIERMIFKNHACLSILNITLLYLFQYNYILQEYFTPYDSKMSLSRYLIGEV